VKIVICLLLVIWCSYSWAEENPPPSKSIAELTEEISANNQCINLKTVGFCFKKTRNPPIGHKLRFWQPELFMETVKRPGDYVIREYGVLLGQTDKAVAQVELEAITAQKSLTVTSGSQQGSLNSSHLEFNETHVYDVPSDAIIDSLCDDTPNTTLGIHFLSEPNSVIWRDILKTKIPYVPIPNPMIDQCHYEALGATANQCMKDWGALYPLRGFVTTQNQVVASAVDSLRAIKSIEDTQSGYVIKFPLNFSMNITTDKVQMVYPNKGQCLSVGYDPAQLENNNISKDGKYVWIYWHQRECCM